MYIYGSITHTWDDSWKKMSEEDWLALRTAVPSMNPDRALNYGEDHYFSEEACALVARIGLSITLKPVGSDAAGMLVKLTDRIAQLELRGKTDAEKALAGGIVQVHIPDFSIMFINEVTHLNDCCTDELQSHLNEGWRILAVCPPNAQRRPDYILGRRKVT